MADIEIKKLIIREQGETLKRADIIAIDEKGNEYILRTEIDFWRVQAEHIK